MQTIHLSGQPEGVDELQALPNHAGIPKLLENAPLAVYCLGQLKMLAFSETGLRVRLYEPRQGFQHLRYPSFSSATIQVVDAASDAFRRVNQHMTAIRMQDNKMFGVSGYARDILLCLQSPEPSRPRLMRTLQRFKACAEKCASLAEGIDEAFGNLEGCVQELKLAMSERQHHAQTDKEQAEAEAIRAIQRYEYHKDKRRDLEQDMRRRQQEHREAKDLFFESAKRSEWSAVPIGLLSTADYAVQSAIHTVQFAMEGAVGRITRSHPNTHGKLSNQSSSSRDSPVGGNKGTGNKEALQPRAGVQQSSRGSMSSPKSETELRFRPGISGVLQSRHEKLEIIRANMQETQKYITQTAEQQQRHDTQLFELYQKIQDLDRMQPTLEKTKTVLAEAIDAIEHMHSRIASMARYLEMVATFVSQQLVDRVQDFEEYVDTEAEIRYSGLLQDQKFRKDLLLLAEHSNLVVSGTIWYREISVRHMYPALEKVARLPISASPEMQRLAQNDLMASTNKSVTAIVSMSESLQRDHARRSEERHENFEREMASAVKVVQSADPEFYDYEHQLS
ncbi:hypothetical protein AbraIFM66950_006620 [Aspergillus brasiliensis]|nr:hypothetical protein AbraIFM66950_006620 [Aspergillus brasiliensis]